MLNDQCLLNIHDSILLNKIASYVYQTIIYIQEKEPDLLLNIYRNVSWHSSNNQSIFLKKLTNILSQTPDWDTLIFKLKAFIKALVIPESLNSPIIIKLIEKVHQLNPNQPDLNNLEIPKDSEIPVQVEQTGIAILLLDAENLRLNTETEQFLTTVCHCPLQVKIAFANWRSMGKLDVEFHGRGYDLIHVPAGKDNADGKMIAFGSLIHQYYSKCKEVLVCSSDKVMTNLCNHLRQNGLTVYQVTKQGESISIINSSTGTTAIYSPKILPEIPSIEECIHQLKVLIQAEQKTTANQWVQLSQLSKMFQSNYNITISQVVSHHLKGKKARDIFIDYPSEFVVHQTSENSELYITLFKLPKLPNSNSNHNSVVPEDINTKADLEKVLVKFITDLTLKTPNDYISIQILGQKFNQHYGQGIIKILKKLQLGGNFATFLRSSSIFHLQKTGKQWEVRLQKSQSVTAKSVDTPLRVCA